MSPDQERISKALQDSIIKKDAEENTEYCDHGAVTAYYEYLKAIELWEQLANPIARFTSGYAQPAPNPQIGVNRIPEVNWPNTYPPQNLCQGLGSNTDPHLGQMRSPIP